MIELIILGGIVSAVIFLITAKKEKYFQERFEQDELWRKEYRR